MPARFRKNMSQTASDTWPMPLKNYSITPPKLTDSITQKERINNFPGARWHRFVFPPLDGQNPAPPETLRVTINHDT